jgi:DNA mismatch endonuclease (patch repair protein)
MDMLEQRPLREREAKRLDDLLGTLSEDGTIGLDTLRDAASCARAASRELDDGPRKVVAWVLAKQMDSLCDRYDGAPITVEASEALTRLLRTVVREVLLISERVNIGRGSHRRSSGIGPDLRASLLRKASLMDIMTVKKRSDLMRRVRSERTKPELIVRRLVRSLGFRFVPNDRTLPGSPDLAFPDRQKTIFVHGCFWHRHARCTGAPMPKTRPQFWRSKFEANKRRDRNTARNLKRRGWAFLVVWECEVQESLLSSRLKEFLGSNGSFLKRTRGCESKGRKAGPRKRRER